MYNYRNEKTENDWSNKGWFKKRREAKAAEAAEETALKMKNQLETQEMIENNPFESSVDASINTEHEGFLPSILKGKTINQAVVENPKEKEFVTDAEVTYE